MAPDLCVAGGTARPVTAYDQALEVVGTLAPEDLVLLLREGILKQIPFEDWPAVVFGGRSSDEIELMVLWLTLGFSPLEHAEVIGMLMDKLMDRWCPCCDIPEHRESAARLLRLCEWALACEQGNAQWPR